MRVSPRFSGWPLRLGLLAALGSAAPASAQNAVTISSYQDSDTTRALSVVPGRTERQAITATFLIQGDDLPLGDLTVSSDTALQGSSDTAWLLGSDAGYQAKLLLNTTYAAQIDGAAGQADGAGALQSLINAAAAQGYTTIPSGSYIKFVHALDLGSLPVMQKNVVQIVDSYTLQDAALGLGSFSNGVGVLRGKASAPVTKPATVAPATKPAKAVPAPRPVPQPGKPTR